MVNSSEEDTQSPVFDRDIANANANADSANEIITVEHNKRGFDAIPQPTENLSQPLVIELLLLISKRYYLYQYLKVKSKPFYAIFAIIPPMPIYFLLTNMPANFLTFLVWEGAGVVQDDKYLKWQ